VELVGRRKYYAYSMLGRVHVGRMTRWTGPYDKPVDLGAEPTPYATRWSVRVLRDDGGQGVVFRRTPPLFGRWEPGSSLQPTPRWGAAEERGTEFYFPHGLLAAGFMLLPGLDLAAGLRRWRRRRLGLCAGCGYDLRATPDRCPECGEAAS
jgi:hypothetical protein